MNIKLSEYCCAFWTSVVLSVQACPDPLNVFDSMTVDVDVCYQISGFCGFCALVPCKRLLCDFGLLNAISSIQA
ncbi:hypothetical protein E4U26_006298 [Claviceps purpurea]|nr:hypothetical protein E4U26_006298 [Claviceps purpurea]